MSQDNKSHFDYDTLIERYENNLQIIRKVIPIAQIGFKEVSSSLTESLAQRNYEHIKHLAHRLKGTAQSLCLPLLAEYGSILEKVEEKDDVRMKKVIEEIISEIQLIEKIFDNQKI